MYYVYKQSSYSMTLIKMTKSEKINYILKKINAKSNSYCIFLDIDGTISEFNIDPSKSFIPLEILNIIQQFQHSDIPIFAVTGRSALTAYSLFDPVELPIAGSHGLEIFENPKKIILNYSNNEQLVNLKNEIKKYSADYPELLVEYKSYSVTLHYRNAPHLKNQAQSIMVNLQQKYPFTKLIEGKYVWELIPLQADKGLAIQTFIQHYQLEHYCPIFIGDDLTDEAGFNLINHLNGISIKVGDGVTLAKFRLNDVDEVSRFLAHLYQTISTQKPFFNSEINLRKEKHYV